MVESIAILVNLGVKAIEIAKKYNMTTSQLAYFKEIHELKITRYSNKELQKTVQTMMAQGMDVKKIAKNLAFILKLFADGPTKIQTQD